METGCAPPSEMLLAQAEMHFLVEVEVGRLCGNPQALACWHPSGSHTQAMRGGHLLLPTTIGTPVAGPCDSFTQVVAHEVGHSWGLGHARNRTSIVVATEFVMAQHASTIDTMAA